MRNAVFSSRKWASHCIFALSYLIPYILFPSLISFLCCLVLCFFFFFPFVHTIFQLSSPSTRALLLLVVFFFTLLAAQLHFCLSPSTFLATDVERSPGSPQIRCCWWPPNSSYIAAHHRVREAISVFISSSLQLVVRSWLRRAKTSRKWCAWGTLEPLYVRKSKSPKYLM